ncbi:MAG: glycosyltransferase family 2 protein [Candidatus Kuenenia sp.]|nr:glycosyltransferase family 2 protein [Candidatus Kuenenia hertensis]
MTNILPFISIIIPCRNEEKFISKCLDSIVVQDYPKDKIEVLVADGMSNDKTREIIKEYSRQHQYINLLDNTGEIVPTAMNIGIKAARGKWIVRLDAHSEYSKDYLKNCIDTAKRTNADNVGGVVVTQQNGSSFGARCVQAITTHRFGIGNATFRLESIEKPVDTVPFGCFRSELFNRIGLYDERLVRNQDYEFNQRIIKTGGSIWLNPKIKTGYYNQSTLKGLFRQAFVTAEWLSWMWYVAPYSFKVRHAIPVFFTLGLLSILIVLPFHSFGLYSLSVIFFPYFFLNLISSCQQAVRYNWRIGLVLPFLFFFYHIVYGAGTLWGAIRLIVKSAPVQKIKEP